MTDKKFNSPEDIYRYLSENGHARLATKLLWNHFQIQLMVRKKARHNRKQKKLSIKTEKLLGEMFETIQTIASKK